MTKENVILKENIKDLPVSENFYLRSELMGFRNIEEILASPAESLLRKKDFSYSWLGELIALLKRNDLLYRLQPLPGSRSY